MASPRHPIRRLLSHSQQAATYVCRSCGTRNVRARPDAIQSRSIFFDTEKVRKKIWGTENPPGLKDPYGGPSFLEKRKMKKDAERQAALELDEQEGSAMPVSASHARPVATQYEQEAAHATDKSLEGVEVGPYKPAETWDGLRHIGHLGKWQDLDTAPQDEYTPWLRSIGPPAQSRVEIVHRLYQAMVECFTCKQAGLDLESILRAGPQYTIENLSLDFKITPSPSGDSFEISYASENARQELLEILQSSTHEMNSVDAELSEEHDLEIEQKSLAEVQQASQTMNEDEIAAVEVVDVAFLSLKIDIQSALMFSVLKRFTQLTGQRIPDRILSDTVNGNKSLSHLVDRLLSHTVAKPKTVAQILQADETLAAQGNVWVMPRKYTLVDKEKDLGRWKVIEQELKDRGLPVYNIARN